MKSKGLQIAIVMVAIILLAGLVSAILIYRATVQAIERALAERNRVGFVVGAGGVVFRTPNSELLAPAWNEPVILADPATFETIFHPTEFCLGADSKTVFMGEGRRVYRLSNSQRHLPRIQPNPLAVNLNGMKDHTMQYPPCASSALTSRN